MQLLYLSCPHSCGECLEFLKLLSLLQPCAVTPATVPVLRLYMVSTAHQKAVKADCGGAVLFVMRRCSGHLHSQPRHSVEDAACSIFRVSAAPSADTSHMTAYSVCFQITICPHAKVVLRL